jgi:hypothetical protein
VRLERGDLITGNRRVSALILPQKTFFWGLVFAITSSCHSETRPLSEPQPLKLSESEWRDNIGFNYADVRQKKVFGGTELAPRRFSDDATLVKCISQLRRYLVVPVDFHPNLVRESRTQLREHIKQEFEYLKTNEPSHVLDRVLWGWGIYPNEYASQATTIDYLARSVQGVYLNVLRTIAIPEDASDEALDRTLLHELVHAYQDEQYDLGSRLIYTKGQYDKISSLFALAEGQALLVDELVRTSTFNEKVSSVDELSARLKGSLESLAIPAVSQRSLVAPYIDGYRFVVEILRLGGAPMIARIWRRSLSSTKELLHPERWAMSFSQNDRASAVSLNFIPEVSPLPTSPAQSVFDERLGEQGVRLVLEESRSREVLSAVSDYVDDRLTVFDSGDHWVALWQLRFNRDASAQSVETFVNGLLGRRIGTDPSFGCYENARTVSALRRIGSDILISTGIRTDTWTPRNVLAVCQDSQHWLSVLARRRVVSD